MVQFVNKGLQLMTKYNPETVDKLCDLIASGYSLRQIGKIDGMPYKSTVMAWVRDKPEFQERYARAKRDQAEAFAEEIIDIADESTNDWMEREGKKVADKDAIARSRLRIDTRKWIMAKMLPKKYGDNINHNHGGQKDNPVAMMLKSIDGLTADLPNKNNKGEEDE